jgi:hypothetical protein
MSLNPGQRNLVKYIMARSKPVQTPLGVFDSVTRAARAHHCDKGTISRYLETDPERYRLLDKPPARTAVAVSAGWTQYRTMTHDESDAWYESWCREQGLDPNDDRSGDAFFDALDRAGEAEQVQDLDDAEA